ncbi:LOW QUALITY PROTEIN: X-box-binding protein 1 [Colossoma macropomum]|uniref:LOW QUALITY PROTEIN: X-box-binding protein 1 n=1 Tax=Colossoma macropomum TaxID=42526 RepID=UPI001863AEDF|nr:LOW QUALITY PROTEIN: X-box-binding protein 1 [Colossoma macropomum]
MVVVTAGAGGAHKVLLISGKQSSGGLGRSVSVVLPSSAHQSSDSDSSATAAPLRKRQRLTHLSPEEKALRRKLKNRVAAQTARDRKKARMGELEQQVLELEQENQKLYKENKMLRERTSDLLGENEELRQRLGLDTLNTKEKVQVVESGVSDLVLVTGSSESAELRLRVSAAGAGPAVIKSEEFTADSHTPGHADNESDLLLGILDILDPELFFKGGLPEVPEPEQQLLLVGAAGEPLPASTPGAVGAPPVKLEALNELIQFDHIYTKPVEVEHEESVESVEEMKMEEIREESVAFSTSDEEEIEVEVETVSVKDEPEEVVIPVTSSNAIGVDDFLSTSPSFDGYEKAAYLTADAYSDSGYERSPSPFSDMSSPLCSDGSWDDMFANELFPQLISV